MDWGLSVLWWLKLVLVTWLVATFRLVIIAAHLLILTLSILTALIFVWNTLTFGILTGGITSRDTLVSTWAWLLVEFVDLLHFNVGLHIHILTRSLIILQILLYLWRSWPRYASSLTLTVYWLVGVWILKWSARTCLKLACFSLLTVQIGKLRRTWIRSLAVLVHMKSISLYTPNLLELFSKFKLCLFLWGRLARSILFGLLKRSFINERILVWFEVFMKLWNLSKLKVRLVLILALDVFSRAWVLIDVIWEITAFNWVLVRPYTMLSTLLPFEVLFCLEHNLLILWQLINFKLHLTHLID